MYSLNEIAHLCSHNSIRASVSIVQDEATPSPFIEDFSEAIGGSEGEGAASALPDHIYMDAMGFGMGCSCLQMTFQVRTRVTRGE